MADLVLYLGITAIGYFLGSRIRDKRKAGMDRCRAERCNNRSGFAYGRTNGS